MNWKSWTKWESEMNWNEINGNMKWSENQKWGKNSGELKWI